MTTSHLAVILKIERALPVDGEAPSYAVATEVTAGLWGQGRLLLYHPQEFKTAPCICWGSCGIMTLAKEAGEAFEAITQKQTPGEIAAPRGSFCAYLPLPCLSSHLQT